MVIYVDLDETLVKTSNFRAITTHKDAVVIDDVYSSVLRPGTRQFLKRLRKLTDKTYILTTGLSEFQRRVIYAHQIDDLIDGLYGRDEYPKIRQNKFCLLIDDLPIDTMGVLLKLNAMGLNTDGDPDYGELSKHYMNIEPFNGQGRNLKKFNMTGLEEKVRDLTARIKCS